ncbi:MAG: PilZ domain-containing protein [Phycisphaerae bacterium]|nr:PilZ domain-containing protein [Phycisphaerae bacterium]
MRADIKIMFNHPRHRPLPKPNVPVPGREPVRAKSAEKAKESESADTAMEEIRRLVESAKEGGEPDHYMGKRQDLRVSVGTMLEATIAPKLAIAKRWPITMHNVSEGGFGFWSKQKFEINDVLYVREFTPNNSGKWLTARVTHCTVGIRGFLIGVAFEPNATPV